MDVYRTIEVEIARRFGLEAQSTRKSIGDFFINNDPSKPVNVKSNNLAKKNYSPNIISGKKLIEWVHQKGNELYFIFADYQKTKQGLDIVNVSGLVPFYHISWNCLTIEAQGWGVIQMCKPLELNASQSKQDFFRDMKTAYESYINKESKKIDHIREMIKDF